VVVQVFPGWISARRYRAGRLHPDPPPPPSTGPAMPYGRHLGSPHAHARIKSLWWRASKHSRACPCLARFGFQGGKFGRLLSRMKRFLAAEKFATGRANPFCIVLPKMKKRPPRSPHDRVEYETASRS